MALLSGIFGFPILRFLRSAEFDDETKDELRSVAMRELDVSKLSFDLGWIMAIEDSGRHDWAKPTFGKAVFDRGGIAARQESAKPS